MPMNRHALLLVAALALTPAGAGAPDEADAHSFVPDITADDFVAHIRVLASDAFGGRGVSTAGEGKTLQYLRGQFQRMGLAPGNGDSYFQAVPFQVRLADNAHSAGA